MRKHKLVIAGATLLAASLAMSACGTRTEAPGEGSSGTETKVAKIGVIAPLSGDLSALGLGIQNSVDLAIKQANEANAIPGWTLELAPEDDEAKPDVGKNAATKLAGDDEVIGVVGTLNSSVSQSVQPVLSGANIVQISPANTGTTITHGSGRQDSEAGLPALLPYLHERRGPGSFRWRLPVRVAGIKKIATIHDKKTYGQGLVGCVTEAFKPLPVARSWPPRRSTRTTRTSRP